MSVCCFCPLTEKEKKSKVQINGALIESSDGAMWYSYRISVWHRLKWLYRASVTAGWCTRPIHSVNFLYSIAVFTHTLQLWNVLDISLQSYMWKKTAQSGQLQPHHKKISKPLSQWRMQLIKITIRLVHTQSITNSSVSNYLRVIIQATALQQSYFICRNIQRG